MVVSVTINHVYKYPSELLIATHLNKYPNRWEQNVMKIDTYEKSTDQRTGTECLKREATCRNIIPSFLRKLQVLQVEHIFLEEECSINTSQRRMLVTSRNKTWNSFVSATEKSSFEPHPENNKWTVFKQSGSIAVHGFGSFGAVLELFAKGFLSQGAKRSVSIMEEILRERTARNNSKKMAKSPDQKVGMNFQGG